VGIAGQAGDLRRIGLNRVRRALTRALLVGGATCGIAVATGHAAADPFVVDNGGVTVDWRRGAIAATAGAAADHRMPSADVARIGAERRAQAAARAHIADVLRKLPLGGGRHLDDAAVTRAVGRARSTSVDYQSNGGAFVRLEMSFGDWVDAPRATAPADGGVGAGSDAKDAAPISLLLSEGHLAAAPEVVVAGKTAVLGSARYTPAAALPIGTKPLQVHADKRGRLLLDDGANAQSLAGRPAVIYVQKLLR
jgi:type IV secretory pathway TrbD component